MKIINKHTNTEPCAFHLNGGSEQNKVGYNLWNEVKNNFKLTKPPKEDLRSDVVLAFFMHGYQTKTMIEESAEFFGISVNNIYYQDHDIERVSPKKSGEYRRMLLNFKPFAMENFLLNNPSLKYVIGWDCTDVFLVKHPNRIVETFEKDFDCKLLFNAEQLLYPSDLGSIYDKLILRSDFNVNKSKFCFLNSGLFIAEVDFYLNLIRDYNNINSNLMKKYCTSKLKIPQGDQRHFQILFGKNYGNIQIDFDCKIFQTTLGLTDEVELLQDSLDTNIEKKSNL